MAPITSIAKLAACLAVGTLVDARQTGHAHKRSHNLHLRSDNLLSFRQSAPTVTTRASDKVTLQPIRPGHRSKKERRDERGTFDLIAQESLFWGGEDGTLAELWIDMPGDDEAIVDMEYFDDLIDYMDCPRNGTDTLVVDFLDGADLQAAGEVWSWVNNRPENHFLLMVGAGDCGWNEDRVLYQVDDLLEYSPDTKTAMLHAEAVSWKDALHSYDLNIGKAAMPVDETSPSEGANMKRGIFDSIGDFFGGTVNPDVSIPIDVDVSGQSISFTMDGVTLSGSCANCSTTGSFDVEAKFRVRWFDIEEAFVEMRTAGIDATAIVDVTLSGDLTETLLEQSLPLFKASPAGIVIPGIISLGPTVSVALTAGVSAIKGGIKMTLGGTATIPESVSRLDFLSEEGSSSEGWTPEFSSVPFEADLYVEAKASASLDAAVGLELSALGKNASAPMRPFNRYVES